MLRLDIQTAAGRDFGRLHGFAYTPTFILFDGDGREVARWQGRPPSLPELPVE